MKNSFTASGFLTVTLFIGSALASCGHGTGLLKRQVGISKRADGAAGAKTVEVAKFGYISTQGPTGWAALSAENAGCATNKIQSPIDITATSATILPPGTLKMTFPAVASTEFENIGSTIEVVMEGKGASTTVNGKTFELKQFHFHSPSEHTINGEYFPLEVHMVHEAADGAIAVIATHFQLSENGQTTSLLTEATSKIAEIEAPGSITETGPIDFAPFVAAINAQSMSQYTGSLTTPPCAEGLQFFVTSKQLPIDVATFNKIKKVVGFNARFTQNTPGQDNLLTAAATQIASGAIAAPVVEGAAPAKEGAAPVKEDAVPAKEMAPPAKEAAPPAKEAAPPAKEMAPPAKEAAPPAKEMAPPAKEEAPKAAPVHAPLPPILIPAVPAAPAPVPVAPAPIHVPAVAAPAPVASHPMVAPVATHPSIVAGAHVIGGGAMTPEIAKLIKEQTGIIVPASVRRSRVYRA